MQTLLGSNHGWAANNFRIFFDPARGKLEPIPWDYNVFAIDASRYPDGEKTAVYGIAKALLRIPSFRKMRDKRLWELITKRVNPMIAHANDLYARLHPILELDNLSPTGAWGPEKHNSRITQPLRKNAKFLRQLFESNNLSASFSVRDDKYVIIYLENHAKSFAEINAVTIQNGSQVESIRFKSPYTVNGRWFGATGRTEIKVETQFPQESLIGGPIALTAISANNGVTSSEIDDKDMRITSRSLPLNPLRPPSTSPPVREKIDLPINVRQTGKRIIFGPGTVTLSSTLEIPSDCSVEFASGLHLYLDPEISLLIYGNLTGIATGDNPILITGSDAGRQWGTIAVQGTRTEPRKIHLEHAKFIGGGGGENMRSHFTGVFSVTDGKVKLRNCQFLNGNAVDGINLKYCEVQVYDSIFLQSADDAVDLDFCQGVFVGNKVTKSGGDGIDLSGSEVAIMQNHISWCEDKAISIGERSTAEVVDNIILNSRTGIACKDESTATIKNNGLARLHTGVALYRKKQTFGQPAANMSGLLMINVETPLTLGPGVDVTITASAQYTNTSPEKHVRPGLVTLPIEKNLTERNLDRMLLASGGITAAWGVRNTKRIPR